MSDICSWYLKSTSTSGVLQVLQLELCNKTFCSGYVALRESLRYVRSLILTVEGFSAGTYAIYECADERSEKIIFFCEPNQVVFTRISDMFRL